MTLRLLSTVKPAQSLTDDEAQQLIDQQRLPVRTRIAEQADPESAPVDDVARLLPSVLVVEGFPPFVTSSLSPRRMSVWEAWARDRGVSVFAWEIRHYAEADQVLYGFACRIGHADHVFVNRWQPLRCPIKGTRAVLEHELEHVRRGLLASGSPFAVDRFSEAACEDAAAGVVLGMVRLFETKCQVQIDAALCEQCYRTNSRRCLQPAGVLDQARVLLKW